MSFGYNDSRGKDYSMASGYGNVRPSSASRPGAAVSSDRLRVHNSTHQNVPQDSYVVQQVNKFSGQNELSGTGTRRERNAALQSVWRGHLDTKQSSGAGLGRTSNIGSKSLWTDSSSSQGRYGTDDSFREEHDTSANSSKSKTDQTTGAYREASQSSSAGLGRTSNTNSKSLQTGSSSSQGRYETDDNRQERDTSKTFQMAGTFTDGHPTQKETQKAADESFVDKQLLVSLPTKTVKLFEALQVVGELWGPSQTELESLIRQLGKDDSDKLNRKIKDLEKEIGQLREVVQKKENDVQEATKARNLAFAQVEEIRKDKAHLEAVMQQQKTEMEKTIGDYKNLQNELDRKQTQLDKLLKDNKQISDELSSSKSRLSKLMGSRLADNNPEIADLSDKNRPTKLAEKFQELYDNEWTDAFEVSEELFFTERKGIEVLKSVLENVMAHCEHLSKEQTKTLAEFVTMSSAEITNLSKDVLKQIKDLKKVNAELSLNGVYEQYMRSIQKMPPASKDVATLVQDRRVQPFVQKCVQLCWLMCVQDPPVVFGPHADPTRPIDTNAYKFYTKTGRYVDYAVWPPLLLQKGGPLLCKGVIQGCDKRNVQDQGHETNQDRNHEVSSRERKRRNLPTAGEKSPSLTTGQHEHTSSSKPAAEAIDNHAAGRRTAWEESSSHSANVNQTDPTCNDRSETKYTKAETAVRLVEYPLQKDWDLFVNLGQRYGWDNSSVKVLMGQNYEVCRNWLRQQYNI